MKKDVVKQVRKLMFKEYIKLLLFCIKKVKFIETSDFVVNSKQRFQEYYIVYIESTDGKYKESLVVNEFEYNNFKKNDIVKRGVVSIGNIIKTTKSLDEQQSVKEIRNKAMSVIFVSFSILLIAALFVLISVKVFFGKYQ